VSCTPTPIRFAHLPGQAPAEPWQQQCVEQLLQAGAQIVPLQRPICVAELEALDLDFLLSWGDACPDEWLAAARFGVWRYQFGDWLRFRGGTPGFWEVYEGESVSAAMLVRLQPQTDCVVVLREGYVQTQLHSSDKNRRQLQQFTYWPAQLCADIRNGVFDRFTAQPKRSTAPVRRPPTAGQRLVHNVAIVDQPIHSLLLNPGSAPRSALTRWLPAPRRSEIRADPFGILREGKLTVLCEYLQAPGPTSPCG
jgi:hypothetical protein